MIKAALTVVAFMFVSFGVQGLSHFVINVEHFESIDFMRADPILLMGFAAMIVEALIISFVMMKLWPAGATLQQSMTVSLCFGLFLASYIILAEPAKYAAPSVLAWITVEASASLLQFGLFGALLWLIYRNRAVVKAP